MRIFLDYIYYRSHSTPTHQYIITQSDKNSRGIVYFVLRLVAIYYYNLSKYYGKGNNDIIIITAIRSIPI